MDSTERKAYYRDYMRLRRAASKAGYDVSALSHDDLFELAEKGDIKPSARSPHKQLDLTPVTTTQPPRRVTPTVASPKRVQHVSTDVHEIQQALQWLIAEGMDINELPKEVRSLVRNIMQGKEISTRLLQKFQTIVNLYHTHTKGVPVPVYNPPPEAIAQPTQPIIKNTWHTRLDQINEFNRHGRTI